MSALLRAPGLPATSDVALAVRFRLAREAVDRFRPIECETICWVMPIGIFYESRAEVPAYARAQAAHWCELLLELSEAEDALRDRLDELGEPIRAGVWEYQVGLDGGILTTRPDAPPRRPFLHPDHPR